MNLRWRRRKFDRLEKDLRALAKQQEILLKRWGDLHNRLKVLEEKET